jgi:thiamine-phosphate pyrophosphorylase
VGEDLATPGGTSSTEGGGGGGAARALNIETLDMQKKATGTDASVAQARSMLSPGKIVGASCYGELALARAAQRDGATYVAFGGFYPSRVKKYSFRTDPSVIVQAKAEIALPLVVIGGMTPENAAPLVALGADMVAAISSIYAAPAPEAAVCAFDGLFAGRAKSCAKARAAV